MKSAFKSAVISIAALFMVLTLWLSFAGKPVSAAVADEDTITVDVNDKMQEWDGWGTALAWWANNYGGRTDRVGGIEYRKQIANMIFSDQGLNLNIARYNLGTPYNPEIDPNWNSLSNGASYGQLCMNPLKMNKDDPFDWSMDSSQIWMLEEFYRLQGDRAISEMWLNTSPWWTCVGGTPTGPVDKSDNILPEQYPEFADYIVDALEYFTTYKGEENAIVFDYIEPMNEPTSGYGEHGDGGTNCRMSKGATQSGIITALYDELVERGLEDVYTIAGCDEISIQDTAIGYAMLTDEAKNALGKVNTHSYYGKQEAGQKEIKEQVYGEMPDYENHKKVWLSERTLYMGPEPEAFFYGIKLAQEIIDNINIMGINAWCHWQAPDMMGLDGYGNSSGINWSYDMQFFTFGNFTRYITPGSRILSLGEDASKYSVAALTPEGKVVVVCANAIDPNNPDSRLLKQSRDIKINIENATVESVDMVRTTWTSRDWELKSVSETGVQSIEDTLPHTSVTTYLFNLDPDNIGTGGAGCGAAAYAGGSLWLIVGALLTASVSCAMKKRRETK